MISALLIGIFGSLHCVGMCAPLMIATTKKSGKGTAWSFVLYHFGRISIYALIGVFFGLISASTRFFQIQQYLAIALGISMLLIFGYPPIRHRIERIYYRSYIYQTAKVKLTGFYGTRFRWLSAGVLNGLLPCGLIYLAAAGALLTNNTWAATIYMVVFGLGTLPILIAIKFFETNSPIFFKRLGNLTTPIALLSGVLLILRGVMVQSPDINELFKAQFANLVTSCGF